jgi:hypothetical protein
MKNSLLIYMLRLCFLSFMLISSQFTDGSAQVAVNSNGTAPSPKAMLDVKSTTKGAYMPRMRTANRIAIAPQQNDVGLMVFDLDKNRPYLFDGQTWMPLAVSSTNAASLISRSAADGAVNDNFGTSVAISGDYAIVSSPYASDQGAAYIFFRSGGTWAQQAKLTASDASANSNFGSSVSISGDYAIVGAKWANSYQGAAYVFFRSGSTWTEQSILLASDGAGTSDYFGSSVSISGDYAVVGAPSNQIGSNVSQGSAYVFLRSGSTWTQQTRLLASDGAASDAFGSSVSISGSYVIVGATGSDIAGSTNVNEGAAYIFERSGASWVQQPKLADSYVSDAYFGGSVSISGDYAIVAALGTGGVRVYQRSASGWVYSIFPYVESKVSSVCIAGDYAIMGSNRANIGTNLEQGAAYIFKRVGTTWKRVKKLTNLVNNGTGVFFGSPVGITANACIVGNQQGFSSTGLVHFSSID